ncbi:MULTISPECIES: alpha/beta hydrolase [Comamonas]|jgi:acetyl esterase|uniref:Alpha/beta hydrolase n=1 Tax=Comamonas squillarum TaxID=2977320 RepID=A0ABY6A3S7_9BURK|nr:MULTISPECIES: alpha/beta hydrolase [Comamonas]PWB18861.1 alpha/beta hydrolase [Comamonas sp. JNW]UXC19379.1 alpha/beta hydrolase [Comamonas sp. PR12]
MSDTTVKTRSPAPDFIDTVAPTASGESVAVRLYGSKGKSGEPSPLVLHFHGGAFVEGDLDSGCTVAGLLASAGARVVSVAYPLSPEHPFPRPLEIGYEMLQWSYKHRTRLAGKGAPMYVAGEEAGANLAAGVCLMARDQRHPPLAGQILLSPMLNPCAGTASLRAANGDATECKWAEGWSKFLGCTYDGIHPYAVPAMAQRLAGLPATLIMVGDEDPMHDEALAYASRLQAAGHLVQQHVFKVAQQWPDALLEPRAPEPCPCAGAVLEQLALFFETSRCRAQA